MHIFRWSQGDPEGIAEGEKVVCASGFEGPAPSRDAKDVEGNGKRVSPCAADYRVWGVS